jgi:hypothetical protein
MVAVAVVRLGSWKLELAEWRGRADAGRGSKRAFLAYYRADSGKRAVFRGLGLSTSPFLVKYIICKPHILASAVGSLDPTLAGWLLAFHVGCGEVTAPAVAYLLAFGAGPLAFVAKDVSRIHVKVAEKTAVAEERGTFVAPASLPFWVIDAAKMAETGRLRVLSPHKVVDGGAQCLLPVCGWGLFGLEAHDFTSAVEDLVAVLGRDNLCPGVGMCVLAGSTIQVAEQTKVKI